MNVMEMLNHWSVHWANFMWANLLGTAFALLIVMMLWGLLHKKFSPQFGYCLFFLVLIKCLVPFSITLPNSVSQIAPQQARQFTANWNQISQPFSAAKQNPSSAESTLVTPSESATTISSSAQASINSPKLQPSAIVLPSITTIIMLAWFSIACFLIFRLAWSQRSVNKIKRYADQIDLSSIPVDIHKLKKSMHIGKLIRIIRSEEIKIPMIFGFFKPHIVIPQDFFQKFTPNQVNWVLLHEFAHIRRWDTVFSMMQKGIQCVFFHNPVLWIANWMIDQQREFACDDLALAVCDSPRLECGEGFLSLAKRVNHRPAFASSVLGIFNYNSLLRRRMMRILDEKRKIHFYISKKTMALLLIVGLMIVPSFRNNKAADLIINSAQAQETTVEKKTEHQSFSQQSFTLKQFPGDAFPSFFIDLVNSVPTNDGKYAVGNYYKTGDLKTGNLILRDLTTGKDIFLTNEGSIPSDFNTYERVENSAISPAVDTVAYSWGIKKSPSDYHAEIRLIDIDGSNRRTILADDNLIASVISWTRDGKSLFCQLRWNDPLRIEFALVSVKDGSKKVLKTVTDPEAISDAYVGDRYTKHRTFLSHDERYIAYVFYPDLKDDWNSDIAIWSVKEQKEYPFVVHPAMDKLFGWSPDGKWIVFSSNRLSTNDIYIAPFSLDRPATNPKIVTRGFGQIHPIGITSNGRLYFSEFFQLADVYIADIDWDAGTITDSSESITSSISAPMKGWGKWSPDGNLYIFEVYEIDYGAGDRKSHWIYSFDEKRSYKIPMTVEFDGWSSFESWGWSKDSRFIMGKGKQPGDSKGRFYKIDIKTGETTFIVPEAGEGFREINAMKWEEPFGLWGARTQDLKKIYRTNNKDNTLTLVEYNRETKEERTLYENKSEPNSKHSHYQFQLSPDDKWLICRYYEDMPNLNSIRLISTENGDRRDIYKYDSDKSINDVGWMPDSQSILIGQKDEGEEEYTILKIPITGESPIVVGTIPDNTQPINIHPSGNKFAYTNSVMQSHKWMMENFLPKE
jgi:beta-lactamase regulating signal transducer with metallopeptidase domain/Tol biopolymer transport system component